jgi:dTDP-4-dehydrorhamnose 3,5-epimerase|tara:strand:+ start:691 stop:1203 length:513 start_codon:yes stop_codon:yes gene_type:complete
LKCYDTKLHGVKRIVLDNFEDHRGTYLELYDSENHKQACSNTKFIQDDISVSKKNVLRGLHGDDKTTKLVSVLNGSVYSILADNRKDSPTYKQWQAFTLSASNMNQLYIPAGIGNSMLALEDNTIYYYKQDTHFVDGRQFTIKWNDPEWNFWWPIKNPILSVRDTKGMYS